MGKKSTPDAPDYTGVAKEQSAASAELTNSQTWANRPTLNTPWGSQTWDAQQQIDPSTGKPVTAWTSNITLSPDQQQSLDSQQRITNGRSAGAEQLLGQAVQNFQKPMDWSSLPQGAQSVQAGQLGQQQINPNVANTQAAQGGPLATGVRQGQLSTGVNGGQIQGQLDQTPNDWRQQAQDAVWNLQKPMLDQRRSDVETQLSNQGLARGSEAWNREQMALNDSEARARLQSVDAGRVESDSLFNKDLQSGTFANNAQAQQFGQGMSNAQLNNQAQGQRFNQGQANAQLNNQASGQQYAQQMAGMQFENQAQQQQFQNLMLQAQQGDQRAQQQLSMQIQAGNFNNQNRQQSIAEQQTQRGQTLNELNSLLTGQQIGMPSMPNFSQSSKAETPQLLNAANMGYQAQMDQYNAGQAASSGLTSGLFSLGSAAMGNPAGMAGLFSMSDERLKRDIEHVGTLPSGIKVYTYRFIGSKVREMGVLAQEVMRIKPEAVRKHASGFFMVNYSMVM